MCLFGLLFCCIISLPCLDLYLTATSLSSQNTEIPCRNQIQVSKKFGCLVSNNAIDKTQNSDASQTCKKKNPGAWGGQRKTERRCKPHPRFSHHQTLSLQRITLWGFSVPESHLSASTQSILMPGKCTLYFCSLESIAADANARLAGEHRNGFLWLAVFWDAVSGLAAGVAGFQGLGLLCGKVR